MIEADLAKPDLGLDAASFAWIARRVDRVLHSAASLTFHAGGPDDEPFRTNVAGARALLDLCARAGVERFFHVSTAYVAGLRAGTVLERDLDVGQGWGNDYERSKVQAEQCVRSAPLRYRPTIFRPSIIVGDSKTAYTSTYHGFYAPLKAALELAGGTRASRWTRLPSFQSLLGLGGDERKNLVPVDWVSSVITHIVTHEALHGECYHLTHPEPARVADIEGALLDAAKAEVLSAADLARDPAAPTRSVADPSNRMALDSRAPRLESLFSEQMQTYRAYFRDDPTFDMVNTLGAAGHLPCPALDRPRLTRLAQAAIRANFGWPKPPESAPEFDAATLLERSARKSVTPRPSEFTSSIGLDVSGSGGGQWTMNFAGDDLVGHEPGLPDPSAPDTSNTVATCSLHVTTLAAIASGDCPADQTALSGRMLIERAAETKHDIAALLQNALGPEKPASSTTPPTPPQPAAEPAPLLASAAKRQPLAIVGMACRLPGADGLDEYWNLLAAGHCAIDELPLERLDRSLYYDAGRGVRGKTYSTLGGSISSRPMDRVLCPLSEELMASADPAHAILCEVAAAAWRHAGYDPFALPIRNVGVYIGHSAGSELSTEYMLGTLAQHWAESLRELPAFAEMSPAEQDAVILDVVARIRRDKPRRRAVDEASGVGGPVLEANVAAGLIARVMRLDGPQMVLDAACASSLTALALAAMALERGEIDAAVVGGASYNKCVSLLLFSQAQSCSGSGSRPSTPTPMGSSVPKAMCRSWSRRSTGPLPMATPCMPSCAGSACRPMVAGAAFGRRARKARSRRCAALMKAESGSMKCSMSRPTPQAPRWATPPRSKLSPACFASGSSPVARFRSAA